MRRLAVLGVVAIGALTAPLLASGTGSSARLQAAAGRGGPVLGLVNTYAGFTTNDWSILRRLDPRTLEPTGSAHVVFQPAVWGGAYSPDRTGLALVNGDGRMFFVDTKAVRIVGSVRKPVLGHSIGLAWIGRDVFDATSDGAAPRVVVVDPRSRRIVGRSDALPGKWIALGRTNSGLVFLLAPSGQMGDCIVATVTARVAIRSVTLPDTRCGWDGAGHQAVPGLAVDPAGDRAFVVQGGSPIVEIDLRTMTVSTHALVEQTGDLAAPFGRLGPSAQAKAVPAGPARSALWLGGGRLAFWGVDYTGSDGPGTPVAVTLVDTGSWTAKSLDPADWVARDGTTLVIAGSHGLTVYGPDGSLRFRLFAGREVFAQVGFGHAVVTPVLASGPPDRYWVVDLSTGRIVRTGPGASVPQLLAPAGP